jgi:hypothetical protein
MNNVTYQDAFVQGVRLLQQCDECVLCEEHQHVSAGERGFRQQVLSWQPIETAPKDGWVLLCNADGVRMTGLWGRPHRTAKPDWIRYGMDGKWIAFNATRWMPLPLSPDWLTA